MVEPLIMVLLQQLAPIAERANIKPICWLSGGADAGNDYCPDCARWIAKHLRRRGNRDVIADGGWDQARGSDSPSFCSGCGCLLGYSLTNCGLKDELDYWSRYAWTEPLDPVNAYQIEALLCAAEEHGDESEIAEAIGIARRAVELLPNASSTEQATA